MSAFKPRILVFAGSTRTDSYNKALSRIALQALRETGVEANWLDLRDYGLPVYDGDLEEKEGLPEPARRLKREFISHHGFFICSPEYNSSIPGTLKNALDWVSRPSREVEGEPPLVAYEGKIAALTSASPGALGGMRGLVHLRAMLQNIGTFVLPDQFCLSRAHEAFNPDGSLKNEKQLAQVRELARDLVRVFSRLSDPTAGG